MYICDKGHRLEECHTTVIERQETFLVCDVSVTIDTQVRVCGQCGADVSDRELDLRSLDRANTEADGLQHQEA